MEKAELKIDYTIYRESYPEEYEDLCCAALNVTKKAYCVYSGFAVGAAVLMNNGEVVCGTNQENVAYPSGLLPSGPLCFMPVPLTRRRESRQSPLQPVIMAWKWRIMSRHVGLVVK
ncbi:MAG: hypothetical protein ACLTZT_03335 [Butyricimonas faecalis]